MRICSWLDHNDDLDVVHDSDAVMNGTVSATAIHLKSVMTKQPAALPSHFCFAKDERELRARDGSLDSLAFGHHLPLWRLA